MSTTEQPANEVLPVPAPSLMPGDLIDWNKYPEREYRCLVLAVASNPDRVMVRTLLARSERTGRPLYDNHWVPLAAVRLVARAGEWEGRRRKGLVDGR